MAKRKSILISTGVVAFGLLWYLFRPDALVISKTVNEPFPAAETGSMMNDSHMGDSKMQESENQWPTTAQPSVSQNHGPTTTQPSAMAHSSMGGSPASAAEPVEIVAGSFHSNAHETKGARRSTGWTMAGACCG